MIKRENILVIETMLPSFVEAVRLLRQQPEFKNLGIICVCRDPKKYENIESTFPIEVIKTNFSKNDLALVLEPLKSSIVGVVCRGDRNIQYYIKIMPFLPQNILTPTKQALKTSTHKDMMRKAFDRHCPEITPKFVTIHKLSSDSIKEVESKTSYPVIVKPVSLASSLMVQSCYSRQELKTALDKTFATIKKIYKNEDRHEKPVVVVEEYMSGDLYSIDAYIDGAGKAYCCPLVRYVPAKQLGIDDFFVYKRFLPVDLSSVEILAAKEVAQKAVTAIGLTSSSAHIELIRTKDGWKIIELGPRLGNFRHYMYSTSFNINHSLNDLKIRIGLKPELPTKPKAYCCGYCIYSKTEGKLVEIKGLDAIKKIPEITNIKLYMNPGDQCLYAKNGGHAVAELIVSAADKERYKELTKIIEKKVEVIVD